MRSARGNTDGGHRLLGEVATGTTRGSSDGRCAGSSRRPLDVAPRTGCFAAPTMILRRVALSREPDARPLPHAWVNARTSTRFLAGFRLHRMAIGIPYYQYFVDITSTRSRPAPTGQIMHAAARPAWRPSGHGRSRRLTPLVRPIPSRLQHWPLGGHELGFMMTMGIMLISTR